MGCDCISQRAAQGSLYRGAGRQRRSERLKGRPLRTRPLAVYFFCDLRSFPSPVCDTVGDDPEDVPEGVPSRIPCIARIYDEWHSVVIQSCVCRGAAACESEESKTALSDKDSAVINGYLLFQMIFTQQLFLVFIIPQYAVNIFFPAFLYQFLEQSA